MSFNTNLIHVNPALIQGGIVGPLLTEFRNIHQNLTQDIGNATDEEKERVFDDLAKKVEKIIAALQNDQKTAIVPLPRIVSIHGDVESTDKISKHTLSLIHDFTQEPKSTTTCVIQ